MTICRSFSISFYAFFFLQTSFKAFSDHARYHALTISRWVFLQFDLKSSNNNNKTGGKSYQLTCRRSIVFVRWIWQRVKQNHLINTGIVGIDFVCRLSQENFTCFSFSLSTQQCHDKRCLAPKRDKELFSLAKKKKKYIALLVYFRWTNIWGNEADDTKQIDKMRNNICVDFCSVVRAHQTKWLLIETRIIVCSHFVLVFWLSIVCTFAPNRKSWDFSVLRSSISSVFLHFVIVPLRLSNR